MSIEAPSREVAALTADLERNSFLDPADQDPADQDPADQDPAAKRAGLRVVLCGSFRRDPIGLRDAFNRLAEEFTLLAPRSVDFIDHSPAFVRLVDEVDQEASVIERRHLDAISSADFVWLHAPLGYVGTSASMEIGHACALGVPVFTDTIPEDEALAGMVIVVSSPADVALHGGAVVGAGAPGSGITGLQNYYGRVATRRGWGQESPRDTMLLLTEEFGELARAVRKSRGLSRAGGYDGVDVAHEMADVQLYLVHLANALGVDLAQAVTEKERINSSRAEGDERPAAASA